MKSEEAYFLLKEYLQDDAAHQHCNNVLDGKDPSTTDHLFGAAVMPYAMIILITFLVLFFSIPIVYIIYYRNEPKMQTRSPKMIVICLLFLSTDSIINAFIF
jgi:hypothetical protein